MKSTPYENILVGIDTTRPLAFEMLELLCRGLYTSRLVLEDGTFVRFGEATEEFYTKGSAGLCKDRLYVLRISDQTQERCHEAEELLPYSVETFRTLAEMRPDLPMAEVEGFAYALGAALSTPSGTLKGESMNPLTNTPITLDGTSLMQIINHIHTKMTNRSAETKPFEIWIDAYSFCPEALRTLLSNVPIEARVVLVQNHSTNHHVPQPVVGDRQARASFHTGIPNQSYAFQNPNFVPPSSLRQNYPIQNPNAVSGRPRRPDFVTTVNNWVSRGPYIKR